MTNSDYLFDCPGLVYSYGGNVVVEEAQEQKAFDYLSTRFLIPNRGKVQDSPHIAFRIIPQAPDESDSTLIHKNLTVRGTLKSGVLWTGTLEGKVWI